MSENNNKNRRRYLGRMTDEEYEAMFSQPKNIEDMKIGKRCRSPRHKSLRRLTDEEYKNLPYGNNEFYKQFTK